MFNINPLICTGYFFFVKTLRGKSGGYIFKVFWNVLDEESGSPIS